MIDCLYFILIVSVLNLCSVGIRVGIRVIANYAFFYCIGSMKLLLICCRT